MSRKDTLIFISNWPDNSPYQIQDEAPSQWQYNLDADDLASICEAFAQSQVLDLTRPIDGTFVLSAEPTKEEISQAKQVIGQLQREVRDLTGERDKWVKIILPSMPDSVKAVDVDTAMWFRLHGMVQYEKYAQGKLPQLEETIRGLRDNVERLKEEFAHTLRCFRLACERLEITKAESRDFAGLIERMERQLAGMRGA